MKNNQIKSAIQSAHSSLLNGIDINKAATNVEAIVKVGNDLLVESLEELKAYRDIHSNNPNKYIQLSNLIYRIEERLYEFKNE